MHLQDFFESTYGSFDRIQGFFDRMQGFFGFIPRTPDIDGYDSAALSDTLQHTATHCNTLQNTATHCDTPDVGIMALRSATRCYT
jgi:hypothetical protein